MKKINYYLWKLKYFNGKKIPKKVLDKNNIPDNMFFCEWYGSYIKVDNEDFNIKDIEIFLKVKNAYNFNIIKICIVICTILFVLNSIKSY